MNFETASIKKRTNSFQFFLKLLMNSRVSRGLGIGKYTSGFKEIDIISKHFH